jgi:glycosyltransferase involved in cell wall biosynthesis
LKKKNIILIGPAYPLRGGIADSDHSLALAFQAQGHQVKMLSFSLQYPSLLFPGKSQYDTSSVAPNLEVHSLINSINPISWFRAARWLEKQKPDLIITRFWLPFMAPSLGSVLRWSGLIKKIPCIALCDNVIPHEKRFGDKLLTSYFLKSMNRFLVMSRSVGEDIKSFVSNAKTLHHPHPVYDQFGDSILKEEAISLLGLDPSKKHILFFGFVRKYKGLDLLIEAMKDLSDDINLLVAGEFYEDESGYRKMVEDFGLSSRAHFFSDFIPQDEVRNYFSAADMIVQPYRTATQSGVAQIAYHFNKPILVTDVGGLPEIVPHLKAGYVVEPNPSEIVEAITDFYEHQREAEMSAFVAQEKLKYSWSHMAQEILAFAPSF